MIRGLLKGAVAATAMLCATVQADVVYNWQTRSGFTNDLYGPRNITGQIVLTDEAWFAASVRHNQPFTLPPTAFPSSGLVSFSFSLLDETYPTIGTPQRPTIGGLNLALDIAPNGDLSGSIDATQVFSHLFMSGDGRNWTITNHNRDPWAGCGTGSPNIPSSMEFCFGATGEWVLDQQTRPRGSGQVGGIGSVPEPATLSLMTLALVGIAAGSRRRKD